MNNISSLKRFFILFSAIFFLIIFIFIVPLGCKLKNINDNTDTIVNTENKQSVSELPSSIPVYPDAKLIESTKSEENNKTIYKIRFECMDNIEDISKWYKQSFENGWVLGAISEGDMGDWSEFYAEAQNEDYFLSVYLYQDKDSDKTAMDISAEVLDIEQASVQSTKQEDETSAASEEITSQSSQSYSVGLEDLEIAFVCASVGAAWNMPGHFPQLNIEVYEEYQFDKGYRIQEILDSSKPDIMIIKECAAYFPPDSQGTSMSAYQNLIIGWVNLCRSREVIPILTTVVPINPDTNGGQPQLNSIIEFNDWIKEYCKDEDISVIDLEGALRASDSDRSLNPSYDSGDGLHPNEQAYTEKLDGILIPALERAIEK